MIYLAFLGGVLVASAAGTLYHLSIVSKRDSLIDARDNLIDALVQMTNDLVKELGKYTSPKAAGRIRLNKEDLRKAVTNVGVEGDKELAMQYYPDQ